MIKFKGHDKTAMDLETEVEKLTGVKESIWTSGTIFDGEISPMVIVKKDVLIELIRMADLFDRRNGDYIDD